MGVQVFIVQVRHFGFPLFGSGFLLSDLIVPCGASQKPSFGRLFLRESVFFCFDPSGGAPARSV